MVAPVSLPATSKRMELISSGKAVLQALRSNSKTEPFLSTVRHFENTWGTPAKRDKPTGFMRFRKVSLTEILSLSGTKKEQLAQVVRAFALLSDQAREREAMLYCHAWLGASLKKCDLFLLPAVSDFELVTAMTAMPGSPLAGNPGFFEALAEFHELHPYRLLSIDKDAIVVTFVDEVRETDTVVSDAMRIFPFLRDYHTAGAGNPDAIDVAALIAEDLRDENSLHIIYHAF